MNGQEKGLFFDWWEVQQDWLDFWWEAGSSFLPGEKAAAGFWRHWREAGFSQLEEFIRWLSGEAGKETIEKTVKAGEVYRALQSFWYELADKIPGQDEPQHWQEFIREMMQNYSRIMESFVAVFLPDSARQLVSAPGELYSLYQKACFDFAAPWLGIFRELRGKFMKAARGDKEAYTEFVRDWCAAYQESCGKALRMPALGQNREIVEKIMGGLDRYIRYVTAASKFSAALFKTGSEAMEKLLKNFAASEEKKKLPLSFREFYQLWWQTNEEAYLELFKSDGFSSMLGEMVDAWVSFKKYNNRLLAELIGSGLPVATSEEIDSLAGSVYRIKKAVREQAGKIEELAKKVAVLSGEVN